MINFDVALRTPYMNSFCNIYKRKETLIMSNIVRTWEDEALPAGEIELTDAQLAAVYGASDSDGASNDKEGLNDIDQSVHQKAAATYGNKIAEYSVVFCFAKNDNNLDAKIDWFNRLLPQ